MPFSKILLAFVVLCGLMLTACAPRATAVRVPPTPPRSVDEEVAGPPPADLRILRSAEFDGGVSAQGQTAHVSVRDGTAHAGFFKDRLVRKLQERGFRITDKPSSADRIVVVEILSRRTAQPESLVASVERGYGSKTGLVHGEGSALIADVLVVRRRVPTEDKANLRNISARNAVSSSKVRFGLTSGNIRDLSTHSFEEVLAADIAALAAADRDQVTHRTRTDADARPAGKARQKKPAKAAKGTDKRPARNKQS